MNVTGYRVVDFNTSAQIAQPSFYHRHLHLKLSVSCLLTVDTAAAAAMLPVLMAGC